MRIHSGSILAGGAAILAAAYVAPALAQVRQDRNPVHVMTVQLPDGGLERIQYLGDLPPRVVFVPQAQMVAVPMAPMDPFAMIARISAMMDRQAEALFGQAPMPGVNGYSFVADGAPNGVCMRSVSITFNSGDAHPKVVSSTAGNCGPGAQAPTNVNAPATPAPRAIEASAQAPASPALTQVAWNR